MCKGKIETILQTKWADADYLAEGGNSWVYRATDNGTPIAIKVFRRFNSPERYPRFIREIKTMAEISGIPGIAPIVALNEHPPEPLKKCDTIQTIDDLAYFAMPLYGGDLKSVFSSFQGNDGTTAVSAVLKISGIIKNLHDRNHAHRDLKPENILIGADGDFVVSDFGLSIDLDNIPDPDERLSGTLELLGSVSYRAPELLRGRLDRSDHRPCDVYSLGRILWAMLFGKDPDMLTDLEFEEIRVSACGMTLKKPALLDRIIKSATASDPRFRITIDAFIEDLQNWMKDNQPKTNQAIMDSLINSDDAQARNVNAKIASVIMEKHAEMKSFLHTEMRELIKGWSEIIDGYRGYTGSGNELVPTNGSGFFYPADRLAITTTQEYPEVLAWVRLNLGSNRFHLIDIGTFMTINPNAYEDQKYMVLACYIPAGQSSHDGKPEVLYSSERQFDYREEGIQQEILGHLLKAFEVCDGLFRSQF